MIIAVDRAGFVGEDGISHQGILDASLLNSVPNITVFSPSNYDELKNSFINAIYHTEGVVVIRYPRGQEKTINEENYTLIDKNYSIYSSKKAENCIVTYGKISSHACLACDRLISEGKSFFVIKLNRIKPIDEEAVKLTLNCKNVYFFEEGTKNGGIAETFGCMLEERGFSGVYKATAITDSFVEHAPVSELYKKYSLDTDGIYNICTE